MSSRPSAPPLIHAPPSERSLADAIRELDLALSQLEAVERKARRSTTTRRQSAEQKYREGLPFAYKPNRKPLALPKYEDYDRLKVRPDGSVWHPDGTCVAYGRGALPPSCPPWVKQLLWQRSPRRAAHWRVLARMFRIMPKRDAYEYGSAFSRAIKLNRYMNDPDKLYQKIMKALATEQPPIDWRTGKPMEPQRHYTYLRKRLAAEWHSQRISKERKRAKALMKERLASPEFGQTSPTPGTEPPEAGPRHRSYDSKMMFALKNRRRPQ